MLVSDEAVTGFLKHVSESADPDQVTRVRPTIGFFKDGMPIAWMSWDEHSRMQVAMGMRMGCILAEPDAVLLMSDSYRSNNEFKHNGERWGHGEMETQWVTDGPDKDLIEEVIQAVMVDRTGTASMYCLPYEEHEGKFTWKEPEVHHEDKDRRLGGFWADKMRVSMVLTPTIGRKIEENTGESLDAFGDAKFREAHQMAVLVRHWMACEFDIGLMTKDPYLVKVVTEAAEAFKEIEDKSAFLPPHWSDAKHHEWDWEGEKDVEVLPDDNEGDIIE